MAEKETFVRGLTFDEEGLVIAYMQVPTDVRVGGHVVAQHQLNISAGHPDYAEDIELLQRQAVKVLKNALEDFHESDPYDPADDDEDDDEKGMGE